MIRVKDINIPIVSIEDLKKLKCISAREQDIADIKALDELERTRKIRSANFCARKIAERFLGVAENQRFSDIYLSDFIAQLYPICFQQIRAQSATKSLIRVKNEKRR